MSGWAWFLIGAQSFGAVMGVVMVGEPQKPITPRQAAFGLIVNALLIFAVVQVAR